jgi:hypothetical protein
MGYSFNDFLNDVSPIGIGIQDAINTPQKLIAGTLNNGINTIGGVISQGISTAGGVLNNLSMPLLLLGGGVIMIMMNKK